ncbi:hypothetical protein WJX79_011067 [Trebouxia sp. C0005]
MQGQTYLGSKTGRAKKAALRLNDLKFSLDDDNEPRRLLAELPIQNFNEKEQLRLHSTDQFPKWLFHLRHGFSLLLSSPTDLKGCSADVVLQRIAKAQGHLYIILHNIEGSALRSSEAQGLLAELSSLPNVSLIASMDHVNTPLLWDKQMAARFNWLYFDVTSYAPYTLETASVPSLLVGRREESTMQGAAIVLRTLVPNARRIFSIIADQQMQEPEQGMGFQRLFKMCREQFLVSSEMTLRSHLTEFKDHQLVQMRRGGDGTDLLFIPFSNDTLQHILADMEDVE